MSGDSMTANHLEHEISTFPGLPGGRQQRTVKHDRRRGVDYLHHKISSCGEYFHEVEAFHAVEINRHLMFILETR
jgi:hypothetical protein